MSEMALSPQLVALVTDSLRLIYTLERWRPGVLESIKFVTKLTRLMCTFLAGTIRKVELNIQKKYILFSILDVYMQLCSECKHISLGTWIHNLYFQELCRYPINSNTHIHLVCFINHSPKVYAYLRSNDMYICSKISFFSQGVTFSWTVAFTCS